MGTLDIALARGWYLPESLGAWSMGSAGGLDLALDLREVEQAYLVARVARLSSGGKNDSIKLSCESQGIVCEVVFPKANPATLQPARAMFIEVSHLAGQLAMISADMIVNNLDLIPSGALKDPRHLGARILSLALEKAIPFASGQEMKIERTGGGCVIWLDGWNAPEAEGRWAAFEEATFGLYIDRHLQEAALVLSLSWLVDPAADNRDQELRVWVDDVEVAVIGANQTARALVEISICHQSNDTGFHHVRLGGVRPVVPSHVGLGSDPRNLSICLHKIAVNPEQISEAPEASALIYTA